MAKKLFTIILVIILVSILAFLFIPFAPSTSNTLTHLPKSDAVLVHSYWFSQKGDGPVTLSLRGELAIDAGALLYAHGLVKYVVISAGPVWGNTYPHLDQLMQERLLALGVPKERIISSGSATDTYEEVQVFLSLAKQYRWTRLVDVAAAQHDIIMPSLYNAQHGTTQFIHSEDILHTYGTSLEKHMSQNLSSSFYDADFKLYESLIRLTLIIDPHYTLLGKIAHHDRVKKSSYGSIPFLPIDEYSL